MYSTYTHYKDSGFNWIGKIPDEWNVLKLKNVINEFIGGGTPDSGNSLFWEDNEKEGIPWVAINDMSTTDFVNFTKKRITREGLLDKNLKILKKGTLIYSIYASIGKVSILNIDATTNQAILGLITNNKVNKNFLKYFLKNVENNLELFYNSNTQNNLNKEIIKNIPIPIPTIKEQKIISNYLDKKTSEIEQNIIKNKKLIELLKEKKSTLINNSVTKGLIPNVPMKDSGIKWIGKIPKHWKISKIKNIFEFTKGLNITKKDLTEKGIPVISYGQIHAKFNDGVHIKDSMIRYTNKTNAKTNAKVSKGDFIFADTSEDIEGCGNSIYINKDMLLYGGYHDVILKSHTKSDNTFLAYLFQSEKWRQQIRAKVSGVKVYSINQSILKECFVLIPPIEEQKEISDYLDEKCDKINKTIEKIEKNIELLEEYKESLIYHIVTGKIDVRGESYEKNKH